MSFSNGKPILSIAESSALDLGSRGVIPRPSFRENSVQAVETFPACLACGTHHGSVNREIQCMRTEILRLRGK